MEEDIKILEELIKEYKQYNDLDGIQDLSRYIQAIENLISRNKELEEENRIFTLEGCRVRLKMYIDKNYIPKSKIREKIEEYKKKIIDARKEDDDCKEIYYEQEIEIMQELLGEEK